MLNVNSTPSTICFNAHWTSSNQRLKLTVLDKIKHIFFFGLQHLAGRMILQTSSISQRVVHAVESDFNNFWYGNKRSSVLKEMFSATPLGLTTPDGAALSGTHFKHKNGSAQTRTVLLFQPNATLSKQFIFDWLLYEAENRAEPVNFILFDYRGCGGLSRKKAWNSKQVILDGDTVYQFAQNHLKVPEHLIDFYGYSLGGGIGAEVKNLHPENKGKLLIERSFITLEEEIKELLPRFFSFFVAKLSTFIGWSIDARNTIKNGLGSKMIVYHPQDPVIPFKASVAHYYQQHCQGQKDIEIIKLVGIQGYSGNDHCIPLSDYYADQAELATSKVANFILSKKS
jgi:hypothetical protein